MGWRFGRGALGRGWQLEEAAAEGGGGASGRAGRTRRRRRGGGAGGQDAYRGRRGCAGPGRGWGEQKGGLAERAGVGWGAVPPAKALLGPLGQLEA